MTFETEYQLKEFREIQSQHFDSDGKIFSGNGREHYLAEKMLKLINQFEYEIITEHESFCKEHGKREVFPARYCDVCEKELGELIKA
jgi:hypothetical protein